MSHANRDNLGYLLAKASQRWNEQLQTGFAEAGYAEVKASYGSVLIPLIEEDGLRMGEIAQRARLSKQTMTTMVRLCERDGLVVRRPDPADGRATRIYLTPKARTFQPTAERVLARLERGARRTLGEARLGELRQSPRDLSRPWRGGPTTWPRREAGGIC
jgi:DNA-binding MarR family transcriptional regulator